MKNCCPKMNISLYVPAYQVKGIVGSVVRVVRSKENERRPPLKQPVQGQALGARQVYPHCRLIQSLQHPIANALAVSTGSACE